MAIYDIFSKRQKKLRGDMPDVYVYEGIPKPLRIQIIHIIRDTLGEDRYSDALSSVYKLIHKILCTESGVLTNLTKCMQVLIKSFFNLINIIDVRDIK